MADNIPEFKTADDLIRAWFIREDSDFLTSIHSLEVDVKDWIFTAYLQGHEDGYTQGREDGYDEGAEEGMNSYDEGFEDARAEFDNDW